MAKKKAKRKTPGTDEPSSKLKPKQRAFLAAYAKCGGIGKAAEAVGIDRRTHNDWMENDPNYPAAFADAQNAIGDWLEQLAVDRVTNGVKRQLWYKNKPLRLGRNFVYETSYDTGMHMGMLKRFRPNEYRDRTITEHTGTINIAERLSAARQRVAQPQPKDEPST